MKYASQKIKMVKIADILPNPYQLRRGFERKELMMLSESIKNDGILSPVTLRAVSGGYETICGQRRILAAKIAGFAEVPAILVRATDAQCAVLSMKENLLRTNLTLFEEAEGFFNLLSYHGIKREKVTADFCTDYVSLGKKLRKLSLSENARFKTEYYGLREEIIDEIVKVKDYERQQQLAEMAGEQDLTAEDMKNIVRQTLREMGRSSDKKEKYERKRKTNMVLFSNTVKNTLELLKKNGANAQLEQNETKNYVEFAIKVYK